jgi:glucoamylase
MPRDIPVGNNKFLICFDKEYRIRDIYFPHVGQENHSNGNPFRLGLFMKGRFLWVDREWQRTLTYEEDTLVANAMDLAGYPMAPQRFYDFAARVIEKEGYLHQ